MHNVDAYAVRLLARDLRVEEEECMFNGPIAEEVKGV